MIRLWMSTVIFWIIGFKFPNQKEFQKFLIKQLETAEDDNARKIRGMLKKKTQVFKAYLDHEYLGCSQEGQNSHIYAPRFGKYANRFSPSTIEKLSLIREAKVMNAKVILVHIDNFLKM